MEETKADHFGTGNEIEQAIAQVAQEGTQDAIWGMIHAFQQGIEDNQKFYIPIADTAQQDLLSVPKISLEDPFSSEETSVYRRVEMEKGGMALCAFTSESEMKKGQDTEFELRSIEGILTKAQQDDSVMGVVVNPWGLSVLLDKRLLDLILNDVSAQEDASPSSIFINQNPLQEQTCELIVDLVQSADLECAQEVYEKGFNLVEATQTGQPSHLQIAMLPVSFVDSWQKYFMQLIDECFTFASRVPFSSIAIPAQWFDLSIAEMEDQATILVLAIAKWMNEHSDVCLDVTIACDSVEAYGELYSYLFED